MLNYTFNLEQIKHIRFTSKLSTTTLKLLKEQVYRTLRDQNKGFLFDAFMDWQPKDNEIMLYSDYCLFGFDLPIKFDSIATADNYNNRIGVNIIIPYSILNGWATINKIEKGHRHVCLLKLESEVPEVIKRLPEVNSNIVKQEHHVILYNQSNLT